MAALREVPFAQYYGSVDSTPLFVLLAGLYVERTGDDETLAELWPAIEAALRWIDGPGDPDGDGFVEYQRATEQGLAQSGLEGFLSTRSSMPMDSSPKAISRWRKCRAMSSPASGWRRAARSGSARREIAQRLEIEARQLAERFEEAFWCEELGTYALALDGEKQPCEVRTSNAGQLLFSGMIRDDRARRVAVDLMRPHFFTGWGIRTVARGEARYNPMSYHDGSIWPHDNALIALGLARYGLKHSVEHVFKGLFDAATYMDLRRLPELFCGFRREKAARADALSGRLRAAGLGERDAVHAAGGSRSASNSMPSAAKSVCATRGCPPSSTRWCCAICSSAPPASICGFAAMAMTCRWRCCARRGEIQVSIVLRADWMRQSNGRGVPHA